MNTGSGSQSAVILGFIVLSFIIFITMKGNLRLYLGYLI